MFQLYNMKKSSIILFPDFLSFLIWNQAAEAVASYGTKLSVDYALRATAKGKFIELLCNISFVTSALYNSKVEATKAYHTLHIRLVNIDRNIMDVKYLTVANFPIMNMKSLRYILQDFGCLCFFIAIAKILFATQ